MRRVLYIVFLGCLVASAQHVSARHANQSRQRRVVGGTEVTEKGKWPWLVSLLWKYPKDPEANPPTWRYGTCGASIINNQWLMSAAHCFHTPERIGPQYWTARMAALKFKSSPLDKFKDLVGKATLTPRWMLFEREVEKIIVHPNFQPGVKARWQNDIALMKMKYRIPIGLGFNQLKNVTLPIPGDASFPAARQECVFAGWGCSEGGGQPTKAQHDVVLPIARNSACARLFKVDIETRLCAGSLGGGISTCQGDSGGPLVCEKNGKYIQVGISSFNNPRDPGSEYAAFTRVSYFMDWVTRTIADN
ncbi:tryptase-like isoform X2 [Lineus longissimus]|uniref:tryptase-like isoform X2 n=1 Tax=Lineus longissimus TaxID=88925 RepID=UPI002B4F84B0